MTALGEANLISSLISVQTAKMRKGWIAWVGLGSEVRKMEKSRKVERKSAISEVGLGCLLHLIG